ncbi:MAG: transposase [Patescibacteria group bacterium]|nr:transposase [Actinomycetota bacterium]MCL5438920.1 transposase [Patescibacteria group bacterium]
MPGKNTLKTYVENGYYHIYNRGIDKKEIFIDEKDCTVFLHYLKLYLDTPQNLLKDKPLSPKLLYKINNLNLNREIDLLSFTLMPNHFHLQVKQYTKEAIQKLTRRVLTCFVRYYNNKYKRIGTLFESVYKAALIETEEQNLYLSSYIHRNPMKLKSSKFDYVQFSSYPYYLKSKTADWIKIDEISSYFKKSKNTAKSDIFSYQNFVEDFKENPEYALKELTLEEVNG